MIVDNAATALADPLRALFAWGFAMIRPGLALAAAPLFGDLAVPARVRIVLAAGFALAAPAMPAALATAGLVAAIPAMADEAAAGFALGGGLSLVFAGASLAGEAIANASGLALAAAVDPSSGAPSPALATALRLAATLLFFGLDGHLRFAALLMRSYEFLPPGAAWPTPATWRVLAGLGSLYFAFGLTVALPIVAALTTVNVLLGMLARAAPPLGLFQIAVPATALGGLALIGLALPDLGDVIAALLDRALLEIASALSAATR